MNSVNHDVVVRGTARNGRVRIFAAVSTNTINDMQRRHDTWPVATAALGRTTTIAAMMARMLKNEERLTIRVRGDGPLGEIVVEADASGHVRGYVDEPHVHLPSNSLGKLDVGGGVGEGVLYVTRDLGLKDYYTGSSELQTGEIADDFTYYFVVSEQTPSAVGAGVLVDVDNSVICSGGFLVQLLPDHTDEDIEAVETAVSSLASVTDLLQTGMTAVALAKQIMPEVEIAEEVELLFQCTCSRDRLERVLFSLGSEELRSLIHDLGHAELVCHYCATRYDFTETDLLRLVDEHEENKSAGDEANDKA